MLRGFSFSTLKPTKNAPNRFFKVFYFLIQGKMTIFVSQLRILAS